MKWLPVLLLIAVLLAAVHGSRRQRANVHQCPQNIGSCVPMAECARAFNGGNRKNFPPICKWENSSPFVCCPKESSARIETKPVEFSETDCVASENNVSNAFLQAIAKLKFSVHFAVVGGQDVASIDKYPFMVAIYQTNGNNEMLLCGGSLISRTAVLTAAHCFLAKRESSRYRVKLGSVNFETLDNTSNAEQFDVISVKTHPEFKHPELYNDIALVKIKEIPGYQSTMKPICLFNKAAEEKAPSTLTILGWGSKQAGGASSAILQEANIEIISNPNCNSTLDKLGALSVSFPKGLNNRVLCAGNTQGTSKDACQGDSGGPALVVVDGKWRQRGIVSSGVGCGVQGNPGLYTRVSEYETWIKENA